MSPDRAAVDHLLDGRAALVREIERLSAAVGELDGVIAKLRPESPVTPAARAEIRRTVTSTRTAPAKPRTRQSTATPAGKSIRVRILDMLAAEDRDFPLTEIIERIRAAGISAHDDAVRSIAVKLLREGRVERVGRGRYRIAGPEPSAADLAADSDRGPSGPEDDNVTADPDASVEPERYTPPLNLTQPWAGASG